ncbi:MAG: (d)CMP kinase [Actinomycetia bacterium]|nr:(d)CMP kinase [Actinomycetes bacterium]
MIIAIDGPAGSGKSTVAKLVAQRLGFAYLDTGAMYRAVAWRAVQDGLDLSEPLAASALERIRVIAAEEAIDFGYLPGEPVASQVFIGGQDVSVQIRTPEADRAVSPVSADPGVRQALTSQQRNIGRSRDTVMEGRDIGTVVFPDAELKVFLTASAEERAQRRAIQNAARQGTSFSEQEYERILADIQRRDNYDSSREVAPLAAATDSVELDTTGTTIERVVQQIVDLAGQKQGHKQLGQQRGAE